MKFRNHYECYRPTCGHNWSDEWTSACDDTCPVCGAKANQPVYSEPIPECFQVEVHYLDSDVAAYFDTDKAVNTLWNEYVPPGDTNGEVDYLIVKRPQPLGKTNHEPL